MSTRRGGDKGLGIGDGKWVGDKAGIGKGGG